MKAKIIKILKYTGIGFGSLLGLMIIIGIVGATADIEEQDTTEDQVVEEQDISDDIETVPVEQVSSIDPEQEVVVEVVQEEPVSTFTYYNVTKVVDGDTAKVDINGTETTLRLIGMDTPETVDPRKSVQCFGEEASNKAKELLSGKKVRLEYDASQGQVDKYGRTLAYIYTESGIFFNKYMIEQGYAYEYTYDTPYKYQSEFKQAQTTAESNKRGLWSPDTCNGEATSVEEEQTTEPQTQNDATGSKYYTSSHHTAKYYYPEDCDAWEGLSPSYLKSFDSLEDLLNQYSRSLSPQC